MTELVHWADSISSTLLVVLTVFLLGLWLLGRHTPSGPVKWPPGPKPWPIIGNADVFVNNQYLYLTLTELAKTYGEIVHLRVGVWSHMVVLSGHEVIREAFIDNGEFFSDRPSNWPLEKYTSNYKGGPFQCVHNMCW